MSLPRSAPWPMPERADTAFYHSMNFPDGESVTGEWDLRGRFDQYVGYYPLSGKTVLDVGTASGFLAFSAEAAGARVTGTDFKHSRELNVIPFRDNLYQTDRAAWDSDVEEGKTHFKNGFWYAWHKYQSAVEMVYAPLADLRYTDEQFDVVTAGAILEHLADPVSAIGSFARLAKEAVVIAFTPVVDSDELLMRSITGLDNPRQFYTWWSMSRGLYRRIFDNIGFDVEFARSNAFHVTSNSEQSRPTIIARRRA